MLLMLRWWVGLYTMRHWSFCLHLLLLLLCLNPGCGRLSKRPSQTFRTESESTQQRHSVTHSSLTVLHGGISRHSPLRRLMAGRTGSQETLVGVLRVGHGLRIGCGSCS